MNGNDASAMMAAAGAASPAGHAYTKITVVGDGNTGKTCMLVAFAHDEFPEDHVPTVFDNFNSDVIVDGAKHNITLWDTAGQEDYERLRPLSYPNTKVFLLCFAVNSRASYENVTHQWAPELRHHCKDAKIVLVATKIDLRPPEANADSGASGDFVTTKDGRKMKSRINAARYVECSAKSRQGLQEVFQEAIRCLNEGNKKHKKFCSIL